MKNIKRLELELNNYQYFGDDTLDTYYQILEENNLDADDEYSKLNDEINLKESAFAVLQILANDIDTFRKVETEFATTSAAYQYLQKRLEDLRAEINRIKHDTGYEDDNGNSSLVSYMFFNGRDDSNE